MISGQATVDEMSEMLACRCGRLSQQTVQRAATARPRPGRPATQGRPGPRRTTAPSSSGHQPQARIQPRKSHQRPVPVACKRSCSPSRVWSTARWRCAGITSIAWPGTLACWARPQPKLPAFAEQIDTAYLDMLVCSAPLHDIGKVGLPDHILLKPGKLSEEERLHMQAHTTMATELLAGLAEEYPASHAFLQMAADIIRSPPRAIRRQRLPRPTGRQRHSAGGANRDGVRRLRRPSLPPQLQTGAVPPGREPADSRFVSRSVRPRACWKRSGPLRRNSSRSTATSRADRSRRQLCATKSRPGSLRWSDWIDDLMVAQRRLGLQVGDRTKRRPSSSALISGNTCAARQPRVRGMSVSAGDPVMPGADAPFANRCYWRPDWVPGIAACTGR